MKFSASIYSNKEKNLNELIEELDAYDVNFFHIDCLDDPKVFDDIAQIRMLSKTPIDLHLISPEPEKYFDLIAKHRIEYVTFQYENLKNGLQIPDFVKSEPGLAITSDTDISAFDRYADCCSFILFMTTTPGMSGGEFNKQNFKKIREFRSKYPGKKIHVDGGINAEVSFIMRNMGVYAAVIGSYLFKNSFIGSAMLNLKSNDVSSHYRICDFMLEYDEIPVIHEDELSFERVLLSIDRYKMGFTSITGNDGLLLGIITNADVRKGLIKNISDLNHIDVSEMINTNPAYIYEDETVAEVLSYIKNLNFPVLFLPVVDGQKRITGAIKFNNLIQGES
ncbi:MAG TPA: CBS domain-containing protein [Bacteroidales bacterium]|nr:CBS domain-containing protein [Bacteroidales bacterium]